MWHKTNSNKKFWGGKRVQRVNSLGVELILSMIGFKSLYEFVLLFTLSSISVLLYSDITLFSHRHFCCGDKMASRSSRPLLGHFNNSSIDFLLGFSNPKWQVLNHIYCSTNRHGQGCNDSIEQVHVKISHGTLSQMNIKPHAKVLSISFHCVWLSIKNLKAY